jgi:hypothetical protein
MENAGPAFKGPAFQPSEERRAYFRRAPMPANFLLNFAT